MSLSGAIRENTNGDINPGPDDTFTVHCWTKRSSGGGTLVNRWGTGGGSRQFLLEINPTVTNVAIHNGSSVQVAAGATVVTTGVWHACGLRLTGAAVALEAWLDGALDGTSANPGTMQSVGNVSGSQFRVGIRSQSGSAYDGIIAHVGMWSVSLSDSEMIALAKGVSPLKVRPAALLHYWPLYNIAIGVDYSAADYTLVATGLSGTGDPAEGPVGSPYPVAA